MNAIVLPAARFQLWPHQSEAIAAIKAAEDNGTTAGAIVLPTGTGKTGLLLSYDRDRARPTLFLVHRDELVRQTEATAQRVWPKARVGIVQQDRREWGPDRDLVIASVPSLYRHVEDIPVDRFGTINVDECHHSPAATYNVILDHFLADFVVGCTATPKRLDGQGLDRRYGREPLYVYALRQAISDGMLVRPVAIAVHTNVCLDEVQTRNGDFATGELAATVGTTERAQAVVEAYQEYARDRRAICFCVDLVHVETQLARFVQAGVRARSVTGKTPLEERRQLLADFAAAELDVLVNCQVCTEGFDDRGISCIIMARPTQSEALYAQCVGRGLRICPEAGKTDCLIIDITDNTRRYKLATSTSLLGTRTPAEGEMVDLLDELEKAEEEELRNRVWRVREQHFERPFVWRTEVIDLRLDEPSLDGYVPDRPWHYHPASDKQLALLRRYAKVLPNNLTKGEACHLIGQIMEREAEGPPTRKQQYFLMLRGCWSPSITKEQASRMIAEIKEQEEQFACANASYADE